LLTLAAAGCAFAAFFVTHFALEQIARYAEKNTDAYLWWREEYMQIFSPLNYVDRGEGRLLMFGASEAREAFVTDTFNERLPDLRAYQNSSSIGTISDAVVLLNYLERSYGPTAVPEAMLLGVTTRFIANKLFWEDDSPMLWSIDRYSPYFKLDRTQAPPQLVDRSPGESLEARFAQMCHQQRRYNGSFRALAREVVTRLRPELSEHRFWYSLYPSKFHHRQPLPLHGTKEWLGRPNNPYRTLHTWDAAEHREGVRRHLDLLLEFAGRHGMELYIVNLPELPYHAGLYEPGIYERYLEEVQAAIGDTPFLDLRGFLQEEEFFDICHPTHEAAVKISGTVAEFIREERGNAGRAGDEE
jgi:hypothetical protein